MKKAQAIRFWKELRNTSELERVLRKYQGKPGYAGRRTLERYAQADRGFRESESLDRLAIEISWSTTYLLKIHPWWREASGVEAASFLVDGVQSNRGEIESHHEQELKNLLNQWLKLEEEVTLWSWLKIVSDRFVSPAGLLSFVQGILGKPGGDETQDRPASANQIRDELLESYAPQLALAAPPNLVRSPRFVALHQHLDGDPLWEQSNSAAEALGRLSAHVWTSAMQICLFVTGILMAPIDPGDTDQAEGKWNRIIRDPDYRDTASHALHVALHLLGGHLIERGLHESGLFPDSRGTMYQFNLEMEDQLQRVQIPDDWVRPGVGAIREIANRLWDGLEGEELSQSLGKESVAELLRLWQQYSRCSEALRLRLRTLVGLQPFPKTWTECLEIP